MADKRWLVETSPDRFETITAARVSFEPGGVLALWGDGMKLTLELAYPAGRWLAVCPADSEAGRG